MRLVEQAEAGRWSELLDALWRDVSAALTERVRRGTLPEEGSAPDDAWRKTAERTIISTLDGDVKGAARKLWTEGVHPPSRDSAG